jgi:hypothetical protein
MTRAIRKILALPRTERWLLVQAVATLPLVMLALRTIGLARCHRALERLAPRGGGGARTGASARLRATRTGWLVRIASIHGLAGGGCLAQSLTIWWLLRRQRICAELRIGVRKRQGRLEAHAWMEHQSRVLNDDAEIGRRFSPFGGAGGILERRGADIS